MELKVIDSSFEYYENYKIWIKGYCLNNNVFYKTAKFAKFAHQIISNQNWNALNGQFAIIAQLNSDIYLITDQIRSEAIFYSTVNNTLLVSGNAKTIFNETKTKSLNKNQAVIFENIGFTTGNKTLINDISQVEAAQIVKFSEKNKTEKIYLNFPNSISKEVDFESAKKQLKKLLYEIFKDYFSNLSNNQIALPLSSGLDSRLIAFMLKEFSVKNVISFTFGRENSHEIPNSQKVAKILGFDWHFINYDKIDTSKLLSSNDFLNYIDFAGNLSSMPFLQDYFAIKELKEKQIVDKSCIFLSGHSADFLAGSHLRPWIRENTKFKAIIKFIEKNNNFAKNTTKEFLTVIENFTQKNDKLETYKIAEKWDYNERQAKFIVNSSRVFEYFDFKNFLIFWDRRLIDFFAELPFDLRLYKKLYDATLKELFDAHGLWFDEDKAMNAKTFKYRKIKQLGKRIIPSNYQYKRMKAQDWMNYENLTKEMSIELLNNKHIKNNNLGYNYILSKWYLEYVKTKL